MCSQPPPPPYTHAHTHTIYSPTHTLTLCRRFAWGRSRVPLTTKWPTQHTLEKAGLPPEYLPVGHTCFFTTDLPAYKSKAQLRAKLELAVSQGQTTFEMG